ncbi:MAG: hypothetical protein WAV41_00865 [Microgenomates group bacterium]
MRITKDMLDHSSRVLSRPVDYQSPPLEWMLEEAHVIIDNSVDSSASEVARFNQLLLLRANQMLERPIFYKNFLRSRLGGAMSEDNITLLEDLAPVDHRVASGILEMIKREH